MLCVYCADVCYVCTVQMYAMEGRFTFTSHNAGEHVICIHSNSTAWFSAGQLVSLMLLVTRYTFSTDFAFLSETMTVSCAVSHVVSVWFLSHLFN